MKHGAMNNAVPPRRFVPVRGRRLTLDAIRGPWRPSGTVASAGVFAVVWEVRSGSFWAPLHDFEPSDQLRLIESCRSFDVEQFGSPP
jgi:hypothetical protein